jgi:hypothetical protein
LSLPGWPVAFAALLDKPKGICSGISILDATPIAVCKSLRIRRHRVSEGMAQKGKSPVGWFFGFKTLGLHLLFETTLSLQASKDREYQQKIARLPHLLTSLDPVLVRDQLSLKS